VAGAGLAALVATVALTAAVPYVALQFKAVAMSVEVLAGVPGNAGILADPAFYVALMLAVFAILFGTRQIDATEHHHGMMLAIALESLVKLLAFVAIGVFALWHLPGEGGIAARLVQAAPVVIAPGLPTGFVAQTLLAFTAIVCLPRQFQVAVIECQNPNDLRPARWLFGGYLALITVLVVPITLAGQAVLGASGVSPDTYILALPLALEQETLALIVYIGGFSAATGMVIVASVALATMVSNDLIVPLLLRSGALHQGQGIDRQVLWVRRATILGLALMAYGYHRSAAYFSEPDTFQPERWEDGFEASLPRGAYFPFGAGTRKCLGDQFALLESHIILMELARTARPVPVSPGLPKAQPRATFRPAGGVPSVVHRSPVSG